MSVCNAVTTPLKKVTDNRLVRVIRTLKNNLRGKASVKNETTRRRTWALVLACPCLGTLANATAIAQTLPNQITLAIGASPGAAYDIAGRLVSRHLARHLPGSPRINVSYVPGAGGLILANHTYNVAPKDGSYIALVGRGYGIQPLLDRTGVMYDARKLNWLASISSEVSLLWSWHTSSFKALDDLFTGEMVVLGTALGGDGVMLPKVVNGVLGTKMKIVSGYPGNNDALLAIERGEGQGAVSSISTLQGSRPTWIAERKINLLLQLATKKSPKFPDIPLVMDRAKSKSDTEVLEMIFSRQDMAFPFFAPPALPAEIIRTLRDGFDAMVADPAFKAEAAKLNFSGEPMQGAAIQQLLERIYQTPEFVVERARAIVGK
jgi:tripartite-type tricarboxylate transporter receptor subunit TctC